MNHAQAAQILKLMARTEPDYKTLSAQYGAELSDADVPDDFPEQALSLLRTNPDMAARIDRYDSLFRISSSHTESYGPEDWLSPQVVLSVLVLLSIHFHLKRKQNGKWSFEVGYEPLNAEALKPVLSVVAVLLGKAGEGLTELSEALDGKEKGEPTVPNAE